MPTPIATHEAIALPALLRHARNTYGNAMREALDAAGYDDIPKNGLYVIGGLALGQGQVPLSRLIDGLRISKQSAGQLVDALVTRGYLARTEDPHDRRRQLITLTDRGGHAARVQATAIARIDDALRERIGPEQLRDLRTALGVLIDIDRQTQDNSP